MRAFVLAFGLSFVLCPRVASALSIPDDPSAGAWDPVSRTYTLTGDVFEEVVVTEGDLTLDGAGYSISGTPVRYNHGVDVTGLPNVVLRNLMVSNFWIGINVNEADGVVLENSTVFDTEMGIGFGNLDGGTLQGNSVFNAGFGVRIFHARNSLIRDNDIWGNDDIGMTLEHGAKNVFTDNRMWDNRYNFDVGRSNTANYDHSVETSNTVDGKPIVYLYNQSGVVVDASSNAGVVFVFVSDNVTVRDVDVSGNAVGVRLRFTDNSLVENVTASDCAVGLELEWAAGNTLRANTVLNNGRGIMLQSGGDFNVIEGNTTTGNSTGIYTLSFKRGRAGGPTQAQGNVVRGNTFDGDGFHGIYLADTRYLEVSDNDIRNTREGIYIRQSPDNLLRNNRAEANRYNFRVDGFTVEDFVNDIDTSNTVDGRTLLYLVDESGGTWNQVDDPGLVYAVRSSNIRLRNLSLSDEYHAIRFIDTDDSNIEDCDVENSLLDIALEFGSDGNTISGNRVFNRDGRTFPMSRIQLLDSSNNRVTDNDVSARLGSVFVNGGAGNEVIGNRTRRVQLGGSDSNLVADNDLLPSGAVLLFDAHDNSVLGNRARFERTLVELNGSSGNLIAGNDLASGDTAIGIRSGSTGNTVQANLIADSDLGLDIATSDGNSVFNNDFIDNLVQARVVGSGNLFHLLPPTGGNYWSDHSAPDADGDGFLDLPYLFSGGQDDYPLATPFVLPNSPPLANAGADVEAVLGDTVLLDGGLSSDPDGDPLSFQWTLIDTPTDSLAALLDADTATPSITPDRTGSYTVELVVSDGELSSAPDLLLITVIAPEEAARRLVLELDEQIASLDGAVFDNPNNAIALDNKLAVVLAEIDAGRYRIARDKLRNDILPKTDGCGASGAPDPTDWILDCSVQLDLEDRIRTAIEYLERVIS